MSKEIICPGCLMRVAKRRCPLIHRRICPACCAQARSTRDCSQEFCSYGFEKKWLKKTEQGLLEQRTNWSASIEDIEAEIQGMLLAWCYQQIPALDGKRPVDVAQTPEGKQKILALLQDAEEKGKTLKGTQFKPLDYTIVKKKLGLE